MHLTTRPPDFLSRIHLAPGELVITRDAETIETVLGSCVAVTFFDPCTRLAAICHVMLPNEPEAENMGRGVSGPYRFADRALPHMLEACTRERIPPSRIEVKIFGGANVLPLAEMVPRFAVGQANVTFAKEFLAESGLVIEAENTGGVRGRKIIFDTATGSVLHRFLGSGS
jgi:chemotaxis protein CheD